MILGAILAGGRSTRFGADKAHAIAGGRPLFDHAVDALRMQTDALIVCGRAWPGLRSVPDRPAPGLGPLGGLCAALHEAARSRHHMVLTVGCDVLPVPADLRDLLGEGPAYIAGQPLFGLWPTTLAPLLDRHMASTDDRSLRHWIAACGARPVALDAALFNINTQHDLAIFRASSHEAR